MRRFEKSSRAELDLLGIWAELSQYGHEVADRATRLIERRCGVIEQLPFCGEACLQFGHDMRWFPAGNYVIFYRVYDDRTQVVRILDGRRDLNRAFWEG